jgi:hypothetical protein
LSGRNGTAAGTTTTTTARASNLFESSRLVKHVRPCTERKSKNNRFYGRRTQSRRDNTGHVGQEEIISVFRKNIWKSFPESPAQR